MRSVFSRGAAPPLQAAVALEAVPRLSNSQRPSRRCAASREGLADRSTTQSAASHAGRQGHWGPRAGVLRILTRALVCGSLLRARVRAHQRARHARGCLYMLKSENLPSRIGAREVRRMSRTRRWATATLVLSLLLLVAPTAAATTVWFDGAIIDGHVRPSPLWLSADGTLVVLHVHWTKWGGRVAVGRGLAEYHGCTPSCGQAPAHHVAVTINLWDAVTCGGQAYYNKVTLYKRHGKLPVRYQRGAPCAT